ncbi:MAG: Sensor protein [Hyphomicrobiales bacterium]|nr:Sensor protein [Hyphomicrobiales bacterium]
MSEVGPGQNFDQNIAAVQSIRAIPTILNIVCRTTGMRFAAVARVTDQRWIACSVQDDIAFGLKPGGELKVEDTICHEIRQSGTAVIIDNVSEDPVYSGHHTPRIFGLQSYISMPIRLEDGSFFGTLCAIDPEPHRLNTPEIIEMFEMFADVVGYHLSAIDRISATAAELIAERKVAALREQFIAVLGHDLRNPLTAIGGGANLLRKEPLSERGERIVDMMHGSVRRMASLIDDVLDFARGRLGGGFTLNREPSVDLHALLDQIVTELRIGAPGHEITTDFVSLSAVDCDASRMGQLASNLLGNAITHGDPGEPIHIHAGCASKDFVLWVANGGSKIPPEALDRLFRPFFRGEVRPSQLGLGLGLHIASEIANAHGGSLTVASSDEETRFTFRLPLAPSG